MNVISSDHISLLDLRNVYVGGASVKLTEKHKKSVVTARDTIDAIVKSGKTVYGVNTGFGLLAKTSIPEDQLLTLQRNIVLSHSAGVGKPLSLDVVRLAIVLKILSLAKGYSGVRPLIIDGLNALLINDVIPMVPEKGSVGASGDLAPLSAIAGVLIGEGEAFHKGTRMPAAKALEKAGISPIELEAKEGLAILNGTQISTALALAGLFQIENIYAAAVTAGAMSVDAALGSNSPFDPRIHSIRGQVGQIDVAKIYLNLLEGSEIRESHRNCASVQDPYCLRCQPQVMGAALDMMRFAANTLLIESDAVSDNPLVFSEQGDVLSGGNFHAEPIAMAADTLAIALAEIGSISERRVALLMDHHLSGLPAFLVQNPGINSGFMMAQVTAAALVSENKQMAHPASVDSIPTSANQEDHVSMATHAARRLSEMAENARAAVAVELLAAAQGIDLRAPLKSSPAISNAHALIRKRVSFYEVDRLFTADIEAVAGLIADGAFNTVAKTILPSLMD